RAGVGDMIEGEGRRAMARRRRPASTGDPTPARDAQLALPLDAAAPGRAEEPDLRALNRRPALARPAPAAPAAGDPAPPPRRASQPKDPRPTVRQRVEELRSALEEGWEIVQPIFARPLWSAPDDSGTAFSFVLRRERDTRLVTVPEGRLVQRFIRDHNLAV